MARTPAETLDRAAQASVWERDQEAWNLPRAARGTSARGAHEGSRRGSAEIGPAEQGPAPPAAAPETTE